MPRDQVRLGMFIHSLEGSWLDHPFWRRRFLINDPKLIARLHNSDVPAVLIDDEKGLGPAPSPTPPAASTALPLPARSRPQPARTISPALPLSAYRATSLGEERIHAKKTLARSRRIMTKVFEQARLGNAVKSAEVALLVGDITASLRRNAAALIGMVRLKGKDEYTYMHSVAVCALMVNFARHLELEDRVIHEIGLAGLLHDVGKMAVPDAVLNKPGALSEDEFKQIQAHAERGHEMLSGAKNIPEAALDVCLHHHEKYDGTGYPHGLRADQISFYARMGAICDVYDALTSRRVYKDAWTPSEAIEHMLSWDGHFDRALLFKFMQSIGVFPVGMLVRLRSNRLGAVLTIDEKRMIVRVRAFHSAIDRVMLEPQDLTMTERLSGDQIVGEEDPARWGFGRWEELRDLVLEGADETELAAFAASDA
ncbi:HD-GYP domain-containing protein [Sphingomonas sp. DBB INV C78]|uniref:HD-GYP domain-containing protein n=1 Tax=Sphingomonas sp. DBB INV C78 TaxID=3349434 RepID=UPI0036D289FC